MGTGKKDIAPLYKETAESFASGTHLAKNQDEKDGVLRVQSPDTKSHLRILIKNICREVRRNRVTYLQLKYVTRKVREKCGLEAPSNPKRLKELPTDQEVSRFFSVISDPIHLLICDVLFGTGLRCDELCSLEIARINLAQNTMFIFQGKGKKDRVVIFGNTLKEKLSLYLQGKNQKYLFESNRRSRFSVRRIEQIFEQYRKAAKIEKDFTPHTARHWWNSFLALCSVSEDKRAVLAGHEIGSDMQRTYTHMAAGGFRDEIVGILDRMKR